MSPTWPCFCTPSIKTPRRPKRQTPASPTASDRTGPAIVGGWARKIERSLHIPLVQILRLPTHHSLIPYFHLAFENSYKAGKTTLLLTRNKTRLFLTRARVYFPRILRQDECHHVWHDGALDKLRMPASFLAYIAGLSRQKLVFSMCSSDPQTEVGRWDEGEETAVESWSSIETESRRSRSRACCCGGGWEGQKNRTRAAPNRRGIIVEIGKEPDRWHDQGGEGPPNHS